MSEVKQNPKVKVTNLAPWPVSFARLQTVGDVVIPANGAAYLDREEVEAQLYNNNILFVGTDGKGAHAHIVFDDQSLRAQFEFPDDQLIATDAVFDKLFAYKQQATFEKRALEIAVRDHEKHRLIDYIERKKINEFAKVRFVEQLVGRAVKF